LQQDKPEDFVIATGEQHSVREFVQMGANELGIILEFKGKGIDEIAVVVSVEGDAAPAVSIGQEIVAVDPRFFRPTEVETLLGNSSKAKEKLGWEPLISLQEMVQEMVANDLEEAKRYALLKGYGYNSIIAKE